jgi:hypothetical protein
MERRIFLGVSSTAAFCMALVLGAEYAPAQQKSLKEQVTGAWTLVSMDQTDESGKKVQIFGPNPKGTQIMDPTGQWVQIIWNPDVAKFKVNNRQQGTPEENTAAVRAMTASSGTWSVDEANKTLTIKYAGSLLPNQAGTEAKRTISMNGEELRVQNPRTGSGVQSETIWRRAK